jgi:hypothetical protein
MKQQQSPLSRRSPHPSPPPVSRRSPPPPLMSRTSFYSFFPQAHLFPRPLHHGVIDETAEAARRSRRSQRVSGDQDKEDPRQWRARRSRRRKRKRDPVPVFSRARLPPVAAAAFSPSPATVRDLTPQATRATRTDGRLASVQGSRARAVSRARRRSAGGGQSSVKRSSRGGPPQPAPGDRARGRPALTVPELARRRAPGGGAQEAGRAQ